MPDARPRRILETPTGDPCPHVEVDVLVEGEVGLIVPAEAGEQLAAQQAGGAAHTEHARRRPPPRAAGGEQLASQRAGGAAHTEPLAPLAAPRPLLLPHPQLERAAVEQRT